MRINEKLQVVGIGVVSDPHNRSPYTYGIRVASVYGDPPYRGGIVALGAL